MRKVDVNELLWPEAKTRLERCILWSTLKFQRCSLYHTRGDDVSRRINRITNAKMVKAAMVSSVTAATIEGHCCDNMKVAGVTM
jgi:hypothetical protein